MGVCCLSVFLTVSICISMCVCVYLYFHLCLPEFPWVCVCLSVFLSICLSSCLSYSHLSMYTSKQFAPLTISSSLSKLSVFFSHYLSLLVFKRFRIVSAQQFSFSFRRLTSSELFTSFCFLHFLVKDVFPSILLAHTRQDFKLEIGVMRSHSLSLSLSLSFEHVSHLIQQVLTHVLCSIAIAHVFKALIKKKWHASILV